MRGGIQKKGKNYYAVVYEGVDPGTGRKRRRWVPAGPRRTDAERLLADLIRRKYDGEPVPTEKLTVADYLMGRWLPRLALLLPPGHRPHVSRRCVRSHRPGGQTAAWAAGLATIAVVGVGMAAEPLLAALDGAQLLP